MRLPRHERTTQAHPDPMHTLTNVIKTIVGLLAGNSDLIQVLQQEAEFGREEWLLQGSSSIDSKLFSYTRYMSSFEQCVKKH